MAMPVYEHLPMQLRGRVSRGIVLEKLAEEKCLVPQPGSARIGRKEVAQFIAKDGSATRFQYDDRNTGINLHSQGAQDSLKVLPGHVKHAEIVQRPPAAQVNSRDTDIKSRVLQ